MSETPRPVVVLKACKRRATGQSSFSAEASWRERYTRSWPAPSAADDLLGARASAQPGGTLLEPCSLACEIGTFVSGRSTTANGRLYIAFCARVPQLPQHSGYVEGALLSP